MIERKAIVFNIQKYNMYDGPGIRTIVFFKGCALRCKWCSNPESQRRRCDVLYKKDLCISCGACVPVCPSGIHALAGAQGQHTVNRELDCIACGRCVKACPQGALAIAGECKGISELLEVVEQDWPFYQSSGGGVTVGGGEPMLQPEAVANLLLACKHKGINTAMDPHTVKRLTNTICCQCSQCTDLCPRQLLGHSLHPHRLMRVLDGQAVDSPIAREALLCSECGICEKFACPMGLSPREVNAQLKKELMAAGVKWENRGEPLVASRFRDERRIPTSRLVSRLGLAGYEAHPHFAGDYTPSEVRIPLRQHIGAPALAVVHDGVLEAGVGLCALAVVSDYRARQPVPPGAWPWRCSGAEHPHARQQGAARARVHTPVCPSGQAGP